MHDWLSTQFRLQACGLESRLDVCRHGSRGRRRGHGRSRVREGHCTRSSLAIETDPATSKERLDVARHVLSDVQVSCVRRVDADAARGVTLGRGLGC